MCLAAFAIGASVRFPLVVASNRDEFHDRPAAPLAWWTPARTDTPILAGRDLTAGGTWMGLNRAGRFALLTNIRDPAQQRADAPSRGELVTRWLSPPAGHVPVEADALHAQALAAGHNGFNLVVADLSDSDTGSWHWIHNGVHNGPDHSDAAGKQPPRLTAAIHGVSNGRLDEPWRKVERLTRNLRVEVREADDSVDSVDALAEGLFNALADREPAPDAALPCTGVPLDLERALSPAFIHLPARGDFARDYGTRCSTVLIVAREGDRLRTTVIEQTHGPDGTPAGRVRFDLDGWPPRG